VKEPASKPSRVDGAKSKSDGERGGSGARVSVLKGRTGINSWEDGKKVKAAKMKSGRGVENNGAKE